MKLSSYALLLSFIGFTPLTQAAETKSNPSEGGFIEQVNPKLDMKPFKQEGYAVKGVENRIHVTQDSLKSAYEIHQLLQKAGLNEETRSWKQLERDRLYILIRSRTPQEVSTIFSGLSVPKLTTLKQLVIHE